MKGDCHSVILFHFATKAQGQREIATGTSKFNALE
jgi:hypothetical protein